MFFLKIVGHKLQHKLHRRNNLPDATFSAWALGARSGDASFPAFTPMCETGGVQPSVATGTYIPAEVKLTCHQRTIYEQPPSSYIDLCYSLLSCKFNCI